ncbi:hypothetical protein CANARDRAFT_106312 [[Candida] arabinofermentans NRRL YB-2248]|uniref:Peroxisome assembly protein 22 n=1 Tax=[Candida] arabinofermentans NRRL YB-2248 TaxID=983967 RepID=A0A1E4SUI1_9ASCO|nr:hypothetical protein CANARDRAFT_106312 [[Candida] arabinofermentans NRRL YB-2248]
MPPKSRPQSFKLLTTLVFLGGLAYSTYNYIQSHSLDQPQSQSQSQSTKTKIPLNRSISLVITPNILKSLTDDDLIDLLENYSNLTIIFHPSILDIPNVPRSYKYRLIQTLKEESIFHVLKQINSTMNLIPFKQLSMSSKEIENFHLDRFLSGLIDITGDAIDDYI